MRASSPPGPQPTYVDASTVARIIVDTTAALENAVKMGLQQQQQQEPKSPTQVYRPTLDPAAAAGRVAQAFQEQVGKEVPTLAGSSTDEILLEMTNAARQAITATLRQEVNTSAPEANVQGSVSDIIANAITNALTPAVNAAVAKTQFQAPPDVSCSVALLTWQETSDVFGRRVANTYLGMQVTVRNLNTTNEFLIHDIQVAVDTGIDQRDFSRFQAGRDKLLVRAVAQRGQSEDRRNLVLHSLEAVGAIAGSSSIIGSREFETAVAVFQGAFLPSYSTIFPDHTVEQLNHINDLVFSASSTSKVIVPIQGSVPLVTFISEKPIEQLPFAWCGWNTGTHNLFHSSQRYCDSGDGTGTASSINKAANRNPAYLDRYSLPKPADRKRPSSDDASKTVDQYPLAWDDLHYRKWKAAALRILQDHTYVVIGGVHIKELTKQTSLGNIDCPTLTSTGAVDISQTKNGVISCTVTGSSLDTIASAALEKGTDKVLGKVSPAKDGSSAVITFDPAVLSDKEGLYKLFSVDKAQTETDTGNVLSLQIQPLISSADINAKTLTIKGKHLDLLTNVLLVADDQSTRSGTLKVDPMTLTVALASTPDAKNKYHLRYGIKGLIDKTVDLTTVTVNAEATAAVPVR